MAVSKKRKSKPKRKNTKKQNEQKQKRHSICYINNKRNEQSVDIISVVPDLNGLERKEPHMLNTQRETKNIFPGELLNSAGQTIINSASMIKNMIESYCKQYLSTIDDIDPFLTEYNQSSCDIINFEKYMIAYYDNPSREENDVIKDMGDTINRPGFEYDPSYLWSPNEKFIIKISPNLFYKAKRLVYDTLHHSARYGIVEYQLRQLTNNTVVVIPTMILVVQYSMITVDMSTKKATYPTEYTPIDIKENPFSVSNFYKTDGAKIETILTKRYGDKINCMQTAILGYESFSDICLYVKKIAKKSPQISEPRTIEKIMDQILARTIYNNKTTPYEIQLQNHIYMSTSLFCASLFMTNHLLKTKALSRPKKYTIINHFNGIDISSNTATQTKRTRTLGQYIDITTDEKPEIPTIERIVKYHTPEWERREHLRKLKSGKIVHVRAARCKRKCLENEHTSATSQSVITEYNVLPAEKEEKKKMNSHRPPKTNKKQKNRKPINEIWFFHQNPLGTKHCKNKPKSPTYRTELEPLLDIPVIIQGEYTLVKKTQVGHITVNQIMLEDIHVTGLKNPKPIYIDHIWTTVERGYMEANSLKQHSKITCEGYFYEYLSREQRNIGFRLIKAYKA